VHHELYLFVKHCGFTPAEALRAATYLNAKRFKFSDRGEIKAGLRADLVLVEGNPLENIDDTLNLRGVWKEGVLCRTYGDML
jgi:imidazolonepropionase-like amidohydrolase